jgi:hypothetical protein
LQIGERRFHFVIHLIEQIRQIVCFTASRAVPAHLSSRALHFQRLIAGRTDKCRLFAMVVQSHGAILTDVVGLSNEMASDWQLKS